MYVPENVDVSTPTDQKKQTPVLELHGARAWRWNSGGSEQRGTATRERTGAGTRQQEAREEAARGGLGGEK